MFFEKCREIGTLAKRIYNIANSMLQSVIPYKSSYPEIKDLNVKQLQFYNYIVDNLRANNVVRIGDNVSYLIIFAVEQLNSIVEHGLGYVDIAIKNLEKISLLYPDVHYASDWLKDIYISQGKYEKAIDYFKLNPNFQQTHLSNELLNFKYEFKLPLAALEVICMKKLITKFGKSHLDEYVYFVEVAIKRDYNTNGRCFLEYIGKKYLEERLYSNSYWCGYSLGRKLNLIFRETQVIYPTYCFYTINEFLDYCKKMTRQGENLMRDSMKITRVGEHWISETELYYKIKEQFNNLEVIQHASPSWLRRQHLDVYIPKLKIAFEYQGKQHFQPVDFFGGHDAFIRTQERDTRKKNLCKRHGVKIFYVEDGYNFKEIGEIINKYLKNGKRN